MVVLTANPRRLSRCGDPSPGELFVPLFARISEVSSLPDVALRIIEVAHDPTSSAEDLCEVIRSDPALATRLIRTVNSSYYSLKRKVTDLKQAVTLLGFEEIRNLAMTAYVAPLFRRTAGHGSYTRRGLWHHMISVGMVAERIARESGRTAPREAYLAGLIHDLGLILIDQYLHGPFCQVVDALTEETPTCELEKKILSFDHTALGQYVAARWGLPDPLTDAISYHHAPEQCSGSTCNTVYSVALANLLCHTKGITSLGVCNARPLPSRLVIELGLQKQQVALIVEGLDEVLEAAEAMALLHVS